MQEWFPLNLYNVKKVYAWKYLPFPFQQKSSKGSIQIEKTQHIKTSRKYTLNQKYYEQLDVRKRE